MMKIRKIFCLFGKHQQSDTSLELVPEKEGMMRPELYFCIHCKKILQIGYFPPKHPRCMSAYYVGEEPKMEACEIEDEKVPEDWISGEPYWDTDTKKEE